MPKALVDTGSGPWVVRSLAVLEACDPRLVVIGASAEKVSALVPADVRVVTNPEYQQGMGSSLRAGLTALTALAGLAKVPAHTTATGAIAEPPIDAALVMLVDLPGVGAEVIARVLAAARACDVRAGDVRAGDVRSALVRAAYDGQPGHPVLLGRDHWAGAAAAVSGDRGARDYLSTRAVWLVECADIGSGMDVDRPTASG